uniref:NADH:ubiquinone reductase (H(+)-translocating) n=1 Tax=Riccardoella reaumuri TaxID=2803873 RepID=A0A7R7UNG7_9ACAR|nr:NADH dehydrogenase subunit 5 [Riccardoella reaumuri]
MKNNELWFHSILKVMYIFYFFIFLFLHLMFLFNGSFISNCYLLELSLFKLNTLDLDLFLIMDKYSLLFSSFIFIISSSVMLYSHIYMSINENTNRFIVMVNLFIMFMVILVFMPNLIGVMIGWDGLGISSFILVIYYNNSMSLQSGLITVYTNRLGDVAIFFSIFYMYNYSMFMYDSYMFNSLMMFSFLLMLGGITKSAQIPFVSWLPAAMAAPTPVSSLVHSSTLVTAGVYLFFRFYYMMEFYMLNLFMMWTSLLTSLLAGFIAYLEVDLKKMVAMSTLSQLGLMMFTLSLGELYFCYYHMVIHALFKALLFLSCGVLIMYSYGGQDCRFMGSLSFMSPFIILLLIISNMSLIGFPFLSGFYSKDSILEAYSYNYSNILVMFMLMLSCIMTFMYSINMVCYSINSIRMSVSVVNFIMNIKLIISMMMLFFWVIILGKIFFYLIFINTMYTINIIDKLMGLVIIIMGVLIFFTNNIMFMGFNMYMVNFFISMGFMNWFFSGISMSYLVKNYSVIMLDSVWIELFNKFEVLNFMSYLNKNLINYYYIMKSIFMISLIVLLMWIIYLPFSLYKV